MICQNGELNSYLILTVFLSVNSKPAICHCYTLILSAVLLQLILIYLDTIFHESTVPLAITIKKIISAIGSNPVS